MEKSNYETLWAQEVDAVGGIFDPVTGKLKPPQQAAALASLAQRLARETSATLVVLPKLVTRKAELHGTKAEWDGRLELIPTRGLFGGSSQHRGSTTAVSVQLIAMASSGSFAFSSFGGIALPYTVNFVTEKPELRKDIFEAQTDVAKGARIALTPLILK